MSVAEKPMTEQARLHPHQQLAVASLAGAVFILFSVWLILAGVPQLWTDVLNVSAYVNDFLSTALMFVVDLAVILGLGYAGFQLEKANMRKGLRSGAVFGAIFLFCGLWILFAIGNWLWTRHEDITPALGSIILIVLGGAMVFGLYRLYFSPGFSSFLEGADDSGWFMGTSYKANQGVRVRRGTVLAILALGFSGIYTLVTRRSLGMDYPGRPNDWFWQIPFVEGYNTMTYLPLLFKIHLTVPIILALFTLWIAWRAVNWPLFADFLIATEAEMNKVSWTSKKRLVQDTIVVLTTVVLLTVFLFLVDILWIRALSSSWTRVLVVDLKAEQQKQQETQKW